MEWSLVISILSGLLSLYSVYLSHTRTKNLLKQQKKNFKNKLNDNIKTTKYFILELDYHKSFEHMEKVIHIERIHDLLLYQGYIEEKKDFLNKKQQKELSSLQLNIDDCIEPLLASKEIDLNKEKACKVLNEYLKLI